MAKKTIGAIVGSGARARDRAKADAARRRAATRSTILLPSEAETGKWNANKLLSTTLGEAKGKRAITADDLLAFKRNADMVRLRYEQGITATQIIAFSMQSRIERARKEIHMAVPVYAGTVHAVGGSPSAVIRFLTNAGPDCKVSPTEHHVHVQFLDYFKAVNSVGMTAEQAAKWLAKTPLCFDCDCEDHTFRFRYLATVGGFAYGRVETGFPKERNPQLQGVACKHVIRVMQQVDSMASAYVKRMADTITRSRKSPMGKGSSQISQKQADKIANRQAGRPAEIKVKLQKALAQLQKPKPQKTQSTKRAGAAKAAADPYANMRAAMAAKGLPSALIEELISDAKARDKA